MHVSLENKNGLIWLNGNLINWQDAKVHILTNTLHYGMGVFEGVRAYNTIRGTAIFRLQDHTDRLFRSAHILKMDIPLTKNEINEAQHEIIRVNKLSQAYLRPMVFYGAESLGLNSTPLKANVMVAAWEWPSYVSDQALSTGIKVRTSSFTKHHVNSTMTKAKANGNYINSMLALREAIDSGCEEALLLDSEGFVSEGSGENIFIIRDNVIYTPEMSSCLDGITRKTIITIAKNMGYTVIEKRITRDEVYIADEAFFTGTAAEVLPIQSLDSRIIGGGQRGPITTLLQNMYFEHVYGRDKANQDWLSYV